MDGGEHTGLQVERIKLLHTVFLASSGWYVHTRHDLYARRYPRHDGV